MEVAGVKKTVNENSDNEMYELTDLQPSLVGGGIADSAWA